MELPKFIRSKEAFFDVETNTIYCDNYKSKQYYHELRHYIDHKNPTYRKISLNLSKMNQINLISCFLLYLVSIFAFDVLLFAVSTTIIIINTLIYGGFKTQEEIRAFIYSQYKYKWGSKNGN